MRHPLRILAVALVCLLLSSGVISGAWARPSASAATSAQSAASPAATPSDGSVLPFPPVPSASIARPRLQDSVHKRRAQPQHLKADAPNVMIVLLDDVGFGQASTFGGEINTPTLSKLADQGLSYNTFHTTAICSPTRAALLTGRNHQRVGNGTSRRLGWLHRRDSENLGHHG
jgi:arylsulfatase